MTEQLTLLGDDRIVELTERQEFALRAIEKADGGLAADELGAALHERRGKHDRGLRCEWCQSEGQGVAGELRRKGLVVRRRSGCWESLRSLDKGAGTIGAGPASLSSGLGVDAGPKSSAQRQREYRERHGETVRERERERLRRRRADGWREDPIKKHARNLVAAALRRGRMTRQPCEVCGHTPAQAHHDDYSKPLEVSWLCRAHHEEQHGSTPDPRARSTDPRTSHAAAASVRNVNDRQQAVLNCFRDHPGGLTDEDLEHAYDVGGYGPQQTDSGLRTRRHELVEQGLVRDSGRKGVTAAGRAAVVWEHAHDGIPF